MRKVARILLLLFVFTVPWEYSLDLGAPLGNIARIMGLLLLAAAALAVVQTGGIRAPGPVQWVTVALYLWFCCSYFWSIAPEVTGIKLRGYFQEMMLVWLIWEFVETADDLHNVLRAWLAGSWVLAILTVSNFVWRDPASTEQIRFVAIGQDPNDVARFVDLGLPLAALLWVSREKWAGRVLAAGYIPLGFACVLLTASRSGLLVGVLALAGCAVLLYAHSSRIVFIGALLLPTLALALWLVAPHETLLRLGTIVDQLGGRDLNQRVDIWAAGWRSFRNAPFLGHGAGSFVIAAGLAPEDTAHNTILGILVEGGLCAFALAAVVAASAMRAVFTTTKTMRIALFTGMVVWLVLSLTGTTGESRTTWLLLATAAISGRFAAEEPEGIQRAFPDSPAWDAVDPAAEFR